MNEQRTPPTDYLGREFHVNDYVAYGYRQRNHGYINVGRILEIVTPDDPRSGYKLKILMYRQGWFNQPNGASKSTISNIKQLLIIDPAGLPAQVRDILVP